MRKLTFLLVAFQIALCLTEYERPKCSENIMDLSPDEQCAGAGGRCLITDKVSGTGYCIQKVDCSYVADASDDEFCPLGYKCDFEEEQCVPLMRNDCE